MGERARGRGRWVARLGVGALVLLVTLAVAGAVLYSGAEHQGPGTVTERPVAFADRANRQAPVAPEGVPQILFGDLHVHSTYSGDAYQQSLPLLGGEGLHPPADACDFARYCSALDFYALTDHAEGLTPRYWSDSLESVRQCNAVAEDPTNPDLVAFAGFEWTQVGRTPEEHYGHKNVIFRGDQAEDLPLRPIAATGVVGSAIRRPAGSNLLRLLLPILEFPVRQRYLDARLYFSEVEALTACPDGVDVHDLPPDCQEYAATPAVLFEKLDQWGHDALVIPHGTTWGFYTPPGYAYDHQLAPAQDSPRQRLFEIYSGHGNSEEYRPVRNVEVAEDGTRRCPAPHEGFEPCCWRAGEIIRDRCDDPESAACEARVEDARQAHLDLGVAGYLSIPGATVEDWGTCGQCTDCFNPAYEHRPGGSAQYVLARGHFAEGEPPRHARMGFMASSDNHGARPGTGYEEFERRRMTEATGFVSEVWRERLFGAWEDPTPEARRWTPEEVNELPGFRRVFFERQASFFMTGGLVAVHAEGRGRDRVWEALEARRVYGTSGDRILLWFDQLGPDGEPAAPMGSEIALGAAPRFRVRAAGSFEQGGGCPEAAVEALGAERLESLCAGECYRPTDTRRNLVRLEIVRVALQQRDDESIDTLIQDPWRRVECDGPVCEATFEDPDFVTEGREVAYYARAIQEATPAVNAGNLRCTEDGCDVCYGDWRTDFDDDCLTDNEERAWSSPIWVAFDAEAAAAPAAMEAAMEAEAAESPPAESLLTEPPPAESPPADGVAPE